MVDWNLPQKFNAFMLFHSIMQFSTLVITLHLYLNNNIILVLVPRSALGYFYHFTPPEYYLMQ